jgi:putative lipoic acid-binding regulatory protein
MTVVFSQTAVDWHLLPQFLVSFISFNTKPMKLFLVILTVNFMCSCNAQLFSKSESDFIDKVSTLLNRATITIKKGIVTSSSEGNYNKFEIDIENFKYDSIRSKTNILKASSIPAYLFLKDSIARNVNYRYVDIV